jgi:hypothetical protein
MRARSTATAGPSTDAPKVLASTTVHTARSCADRWRLSTQSHSSLPQFLSASVAEPDESWHADWRARLTRNLSRRSDGRWEPLTWFHAAMATEPL